MCVCVVYACSSRLSCRLFPTRRITIYWLLSANVLCVLSAFHLPRSPTLTAAKRFGNGAIMRDRINERIRKELEVEYGMDMNIYF